MDSSRDYVIYFYDGENTEHAEAMLNMVFNSLQKVKSYINCCEVIDLNRYKIITNTRLVEEAILYKQHKPFIFINNKN